MNGWWDGLVFDRMDEWPVKWIVLGGMDECLIVWTSD